MKNGVINPLLIGLLLNSKTLLKLIATFIIILNRRLHFSIEYRVDTINNQFDQGSVDQLTNHRLETVNSLISGLKLLKKLIVSSGLLTP